jgi:hypothetical protein
MNEKDREDGHQPQNGRGTMFIVYCQILQFRYITDTIINSDSENGLAREASESMVGRIERSQRTPLIVDDIDLEEIFKDYCDECGNNFE